MKNFDEWNELKKDSENIKKLPHFHEREVWFIKIGKNLGIESNGKGKLFLRPVLIFKKFNKEQFIGLPLTSQSKTSKFYFKLREDSYIILTQCRTFSAKRLEYKKFAISGYIFNKIIKEYNKIITPKREMGLNVSISDKIISSKLKNVNNLPNIYKSQLRDIIFGKNVKIVTPSNLYECFLDDNVFVGPFCEIQKGVKIGKNTRIQSHTFICELVTIGKNCFIGHGVMFINDLFQEGKPAGDSKLWKETIIEDNVSIGSNATILPVKICSNVVIGAGSVVTKDINESGIYAGNPAKKIRNL